MSKKQTIATYPEKIIHTVISDMMAYHKHGYTFDDFCDRNTYGRNYGKELYPFWEETLAQFKEGLQNDCAPEDHAYEGQPEKQGRGRKRKQHV